MNQRSLTEQALYLILGRCFAYLLIMLHPVVFVRVFNKEDYGIYAQLNLIYATIYSLAEMGIAHMLFFYLPRFPDRKNALITQNLIYLTASGLLAFGGLLFFKAEIAAFFNSPKIISYIPLVAGYCFFMVGSSMLEANMIAEGKSHFASIVTIILQVIYSSILVSTALLSKNMYYVVAGILCFSFIRFVFYIIYLNTEYRLSLKEIDYGFWKDTIYFSIPFGIANIALFFQTKFHNFVVSSLFTSSTFAIYTIGTLSLPIVGIITLSASNVMVPELSRCFREGRPGAIHGIWNNAIRKMNLFLFPTFVFFFVTAPEFILGLFTVNYADSLPIFRFSIMSILISSINCGAIFNAFKGTRFLLGISLLRVLISLIIVYSFTVTWGLLGAVIANFLVTLIITSLELVKVRTFLNVSYFKVIQWWTNTKIFLVASVSGLSILALRELLDINLLIFLGISFVIYMFCYIILSVISGIVAKEDIKLFQNYLDGVVGFLKAKTGACIK